MSNVLVLGIKGMLGSMVYNYFYKHTNHKTAGSLRGAKEGFFFNDNSNCFQLNAEENLEMQLTKICRDFRPDYIINTIGIIKPYCKDNDMNGVLNAVRINSLFPHLLSKFCAITYPDIKIIQIATDCVYSGRKGNYIESDPHDPIDVYGKTKSLGEVISGNLLNIRCSIIGPEIKGNLSILEWFLSHSANTHLTGFSHHRWNGMTTLQFAEACNDIISNNKFDQLRKLNFSLHYILNETVNKYELLNILNEVYDRNYIIENRADIGEPIDRSLASKYIYFQICSMRTALQNLFNYCKESQVFLIT